MFFCVLSCLGFLALFSTEAKNYEIFFDFHAVEGDAIRGIAGYGLQCLRRYCLCGPFHLERRRRKLKLGHRCQLVDDWKFWPGRKR